MSNLIGNHVPTSAWDKVVLADKLNLFNLQFYSICDVLFEVNYFGFSLLMVNQFPTGAQWNLMKSDSNTAANDPFKSTSIQM